MSLVVIDLERELENKEECPVCEGLGGYDKSKDCEVYDDYEECSYCQGTGYIE